MIILVIYLFVGFIVWWIAARLITKDRTYTEFNYWSDKRLKEPREATGEDLFVGVFQGSFIAVSWPLIAAIVVLVYGFKIIFFPDKIDYKAGWHQARKAFK